jgi:hypothetical protein
MFEQKRFAGRHLLTFESQKLNYFGKKGGGAGVLTLQCNSYLSHVRPFFKLSSNFLSLISFSSNISMIIMHYYTIILCDFFYPFKTQGRIILGRTSTSCCLTPFILFNFRYKKIKTYVQSSIFNEIYNFLIDEYKYN